MKLYFKIFFFISLLTSGNAIVAQDYNSARLSVLYGGNVVFNFNSIDDFKDGIRINNGSTLGITLIDNNEPGAIIEGFTLRFRSFNSQATIDGSIYSLPLSTIEVEATNNLGLPSPNSYYTGLQSLSASWINLLEYTQNPVTPPDFNNLNWANHQVNLSYQCGVSTSLLGEQGDYYTVEIEIELIPTGSGF